MPGSTLDYVRFLDDFPAISDSNNVWTDTRRGFADDKIYVVQTIDEGQSNAAF